ncbi:hypothetical protein K437DRAFT_238871 [Tilletiaria anomala UBC 951]|uniref:CHL4-domain-containing protein n=1 Tax=Tilletiaria anomala (strain ATCC 24038 / CBS 436.72 / UBC 951) TaxID=1037660 RepID=A0A066VG45_TILAU|nr:uncharacterized protein K437DRAFT_238871 [Tilletiaria anomala UBC 951]KDN40431.1 hypothetical protein K437DRAFT_238871 [Tilletiaria anomala UBC 951]
MSRPSLTALPGPSSLLTSYEGQTVSPSSSHARKLLMRLDKPELISLALGWLRFSSSIHLPPQLSRRPPREHTQRRGDWAALDLSEERRARTLEDCITIWDGPMRDQRVPKVRAVDRVLEVDWSDGLSFGMLAEIELAYLKARRTSRTWVAAKLEYAPDRVQHPTVSSVLLRDLYTQELRHYFAHYLHLSQPRTAVPSTPPRSVSPPPTRGAEKFKTASGDDWTTAFTCLRLTLAPTSAELCASGFYILHIPRTPWLLISGSPGRGLENRTIALAAFAQAAGARSVNVSIPPIQFQAAITAGKAAMAAADDTVTGGEREVTLPKNVAELKGRDPLSLRDILARDALPGGGKGLDMVTGYVEDGPLVDAVHRRRETEAVIIYGRLLTPPPSLEERREQQDIGAALGQHAPALHASVKRLSDREVEQRRFKRRREAKEMFGAQGDDSLPMVPRIDFELRLPFPRIAPYKVPSMALLDAEPIRIRLEGSHVQAGLRKLVLAGLDERADATSTSSPAAASSNVVAAEASESTRDSSKEYAVGLPSWLTQVKGTNVVIGLRERAASTVGGGSSSRGSHAPRDGAGAAVGAVRAQTGPMADQTDDADADR